MFRKLKILTLVLLGTLVLNPMGLAQKYKIDTAHSNLQFKITHLVVTKVKGTFDKLEGSFFYDPKDLSKFSAVATIDTNSINTKNEKRDKHLRSKDFFDVNNKKKPKHRTLTFKSIKVELPKKKKNPTKFFKLHGLLTIKGITKKVILDVEIGGIAKDPWGNVKAGLSAKTTINRKDFNLMWNKKLDAGGFLIGEKVAIEIEIEGNLIK